MKGKAWRVLAVLVLVAMVVTMVPFAVGNSTNSMPPWDKGIIDVAAEGAKAMMPPEQQSNWSSKPVKVNIQVNLESEEDKEYIQEILNKIESHGWITSVFVTGMFASGHPEVAREIEGRGHYIGVYGWKDEDLSLLDYTEQLRLINKSIAAVRSAVSNPKYVVDFKPQNLKYNDDTIKALQDLQMNSITATFSANETFVQCPYAKSVGKVTFPYPITTDFAAVPVSDVKIGSEVVLLNDGEVFSKLATHDCLRYLKDEFDAHNETKDPMVVVISPSVTGAEETKLQVFSQFLDYVEEKGGKVKPTAPITVLTTYIPSLHITSAPENACPGEAITVTVVFTAAIYCPDYYFRIYGKYPSDTGWTLLAEHYHGAETGTFSFVGSFTIPKPPESDNSYKIRAVGQGCDGTCWPTPYIYERMDETTVKVARIEIREVKIMGKSTSPLFDPSQEGGSEKAKVEYEITPGDFSGKVVFKILDKNDAEVYKKDPASKTEEIWNGKDDAGNFLKLDRNPFKAEVILMKDDKECAKDDTKVETASVRVKKIEVTKDVVIRDDAGNIIPDNIWESDFDANGKLLPPSNDYPIAAGFKTHKPHMKVFLGEFPKNAKPPGTLKVEYKWKVVGETGIDSGGWKNLPITAQASGWTGEFDIDKLPQKVGKFYLEMEFKFSEDGKKIDDTQTTRHKLFVTLEDPKSVLPGTDIPKVKWLEVATDWANGTTNNGAAVLSINNKEYSNPFGWKYPDPGVNSWDGLVEGIPPGEGNCYTFRDVWRGLSAVLGIPTGRDQYRPSKLYMTGLKKALDNNAYAPARSNGSTTRDRWVFSNHQFGTYSSKLYDPTFGFAGFTNKEGNVYCKFNTSTIGGRFVCKPLSPPPNYCLLKPEGSAHGWSLFEYECTNPFNSTGLGGSEFTGNFSDYGVDTDANGLYDYLLTELGINVTEAGNYSIFGTLKSNESFIAVGSLVPGLGINSSAPHIYTSLDTGNQTVKLYFVGRDIYESGINGNYSVNSLLHNESGIQIDSASFNTSAYNYTQFQGLLIELINISDYGKDTDGDGLFDYLTVPIDLNVTRNGNYSIEGILFSNGNYIAAVANYTYLNEGTETVDLDFDGLTIRQCRINGPYTLDISLSDENYYKTESYNTSAYNYTDFQIPIAWFTGTYSDYGTDSDGDSLYNYLTTEIEVNVTSAGNYSIAGRLYDGNETYMVTADNYTYLDIGDQSVKLNFDGTYIYKHRVNGPCNLKYLRLYDENGSEVDSIENAYNTSAYNYTDFQSPSVSFRDTYSDYGMDTNGDGLYENLTIDVGVNATVAGNYTLTVQLNDNNGSGIVQASNYTYLNVGNQSMLLNFDGLTIREHGMNGTYRLSYLALYNENDTLIDHRYDAYNTSAYNYTEFQKPPAEFNDTYLDYGTDTDGNGLYDHLIIEVGLNVRDAGNYSITGQLDDNNGIYTTWTYNYTYLNAGIQSLQLNFDGIAIHEHGVNGSYNLSDLVLYDEEGKIIDYRLYAYTTSTYNYPDFQLSGVITGFVIDDKGIPVHGAYVTANGTSYGSSYTDVNGSYIIRRLQTGRYGINVEAPPNINLLGSSTLANVTAGETTVVNFTLRQGGIIKGTVTDYNGDPVPDTYILAVGPVTTSTITDINGSYNIMGLESGSYTIRVEPLNPNLMTASDDVYLIEGQTIARNFTLQAAGSIAGNTTDVTGTGIANVIVYVSGYETARHRTGESGYYVIPRLQAGTYTVNVDASETDFEDNSTTVEVTPGQTTITDFVLKEFQGGSMAGRVTDANGTGVSNARVVASGPGYGESYTDDTGCYVIQRLLVGNYAVSAYPPYGTNLVSNSTTATVNLRETTSVNFILREGGKIAGRVTYENGTGIYKYAYIEVYNWTFGIWESNYTNETGYYEIVGLEAGDYIVTAYPPYGTNLISNSTVASVMLDETMIVNLVLHKAPAEFNDVYSDTGTDTDGDGLYNYLTIGVGVNVTKAGRYEISGELYENGTYDRVVEASNMTELSAGNNTIQLRFSGIMLRVNGYNGTYDLKSLYLYNASTGEQFDYRSYAHTTSWYNWTDFEEPKAMILIDQTHSNDAWWGKYYVWKEELTDRDYFITEMWYWDVNMLNETEVFIIPRAMMGYTPTERSAIQSYIRNGGGLLVIGDDYPAIYTSLTSFVGINWTEGGVSGVTTNISAHPITEGVCSVYLSLPEAKMNVSVPARGIVNDTEGNTMLAVSEVEYGRVVGFADEDSLYSWSITEEDNMELAINMIEWLSFISVVTPKPDLVITDAWVCWPDNCTICYNVTNMGNGTALAGHNTTLYVPEF